MSERQTDVVYTAKRGFRQLSPIPSMQELEEFYGEEYFSANPGRAPDIKRLAGTQAARDAEREWRTETIYADIAYYIEELVPGAIRLIDVGSGSGEFVVYGSSRPGWSACGVELARDGVALSQDRGANVVRGTIHDADEAFGSDFDAVTMFNVLEHVPDPVDTLRAAHGLLRPGGVLIVQVPNDYSALQQAVRDFMDVEPWWIAIPDHINYFDFESLDATLTHYGFETEVRYGTFPMEFFLIAGVDYLDNREAGSKAHRRRCDFEMSLGGSQRRELFERLGRAGLGRNAVIVARRPKAEQS